MSAKEHIAKEEHSTKEEHIAEEQTTKKLSISIADDAVWIINLKKDDSDYSPELVSPSKSRRVALPEGVREFIINIDVAAAPGTEFEIKYDGKSVVKSQTGPSGGALGDTILDLDLLG